MPKIHLYLLFLFLGFSSFAQNSITLKGKIIDQTNKLPLESATVYLTTVKDSTIIDYTISDKNGNFSLGTKKITKPVFLKVSFVGYEDYKLEIKELASVKDFGNIFVHENAKSLNEVTIKTEAPPVRIKKDTLEFNASSFKVRPDSNVETLLKQLPGVAIDSKGKITVNGKEVNNILVNGKPFFGKDGKVATENLPADIIDKVQISDTKTKEEELSGEAASSDEKTINLTIQKDKNKGLFGKFSGGLGSNDRYESSGLINYFKDKQKFSFLGSSNNINSVGFSMDEIFDSMGGGRNVYSSGDGSFNIDGQQFGGGTGITQSNMIGLNYADEIAKKKIEPSGSYFFNSSETNNVNKTRSQDLATESITESNATSRKISDGHNLNFDFEYKIDSLTTISIKPNIKLNKSRYTAERNKITTNKAGELSNDSQGYNDNNSDSKSIQNEITFFRKINKKGRAFLFSLASENNNDTSDLLTISETNTYIENPGTIKRNQIEKNSTTYDKYFFSGRYTEPINDSVTISIGGNYRISKSIDRKNTFDFNPISSVYDDENDSQSNYISSKIDMLRPFVAINIRKKKLYIGANLGTEITKFDNFSTYIGNTTVLNKNYMLPSLRGYMNYTISKSKSVYFHYGYKEDLPSAYQLMPVINLSDPLNTIVGNPDLKPTENHDFYMGYNNYDYATKSGFNFYSGGNFYNNQVVESTVYDENFKSTTTFQNMGSTNSFYTGFNINKSIKKEQNVFKYSLGVYSNFNLSRGLTNNSAYKASAYQLSPSIELAYEYGDLFTIAPSYNYSFNKTDFDNYVFDKKSNFVHNLKLEITSRWPKNWVFGNDFGYTYNSDISDGFKKDFYLWNSSLGYNFFKDKLLAKVKVYDILNQNTSTSRSITPRAIQDIQNTVLKRYVMFSLTFKFEKFGGKKKSEWEEDN